MGVMSNQQQISTCRCLRPDFAESATDATLSGLLRAGDVTDCTLESCCRRLEERFRAFAAICPAPEWAPGLQVTAEMRQQYELYLPLAEIRAAFAALCRRSCLYEPCFAATPLSTALSWPEVLARLQPLQLNLNPALLLQELARCEQLRAAFLAALFIPGSFGGGFGRYPLQADYLLVWLEERKKRLAGKVSVLDAACGTGEGVYETAAMLFRLGFSAAAATVDGCTLEPLELVAAARGWFPHDRPRAALFREAVAPLLADGGGAMIRFYQEDLCRPLPDKLQYDVILCNGLLGGPLLQEKGGLAAVIELLASRLNHGGVLLAADRFHEGWRKKTPPAAIEKLLAAAGLEILSVGEGVGAVRTE